MKIHRITGSPSPELAAALAEFEKEFSYPLGVIDSFTISHGEDYTRFFCGMGNADIYLAEAEGKILGTQAVVGRLISLADGTTIPAAYLCDTKIVSRMHGKMVLGRLVMAACRETMVAGYQSAFSVVMDGSIPSDQYTGRLDIPQFHALGRLAILRFDTGSDFPGFPSVSGAMAFHRPEGGDGALCSEMKPLKLSVAGASGTVIDTRRGKRLHSSDGSEMVSAHLTDLSFTNAAGLTSLIRLANETAADLGYPGLFVAFPENLFPHAALCASVGKSASIASATVFGTGLPKGDWIINTSEI